MNYEYLKEKMDSFFARTTPEEIIDQLELLGYEFESCSDQIEFGLENANELSSIYHVFVPVFPGKLKLVGYTESDSMAAAA